MTDLTPECPRDAAEVADGRITEHNNESQELITSEICW